MKEENKNIFRQKKSGIVAFLGDVNSVLFLHSFGLIEHKTHEWIVSLSFDK